MPTPRKYANAAEKQAAYRHRLNAQTQSKTTPPAPGYKRWNAMRSQSLCILELAITEMETYYDQRSDAWQESERGEALTEMTESMAEIAAVMRELDS
jgi:hypothetical protein